MGNALSSTMNVKAGTLDKMGLVQSQPELIGGQNASTKASKDGGKAGA